MANPRNTNSGAAAGGSSSTPTTASNDADKTPAVETSSLSTGSASGSDAANAPATQPATIVEAPTQSNPFAEQQEQLATKLQEARGKAKDDAEYHELAAKIYSEVFGKVTESASGAGAGVKTFGSPEPEDLTPRKASDYGIPEGTALPAGVDFTRASELMSGRLQAATAPTVESAFGAAPTTQQAASQQAQPKSEIGQLVSQLASAISGQSTPHPPTFGMDRTVPGGKAYNTDLGMFVNANGQPIEDGKLTSVDKEVQKQAEARKMFVAAGAPTLKELDSE